MSDQNPRLGILLMVITMFIFAMQDGISRHLAGTYNVYMVIMIRYWVFAAFVVTWSSIRAGGIRRAASTTQPFLQFFRGALLALEVVVMVIGFVRLGLVESHAMFATYPLLITALAVPLLGERVGWRRWMSVAAGFVGVLIILQPGMGVLSPDAIFPLASAGMFALYGLLNRYVARRDPSTVTFFYTGISGAVVMTLIGVWFWEPMTAGDWAWMLLLCASSILGHYLLIRAYELSEASAIQPFAYLQLAFASVLGVVVFGDIVRPNVALGTAIVVAAGLFALLRAARPSAR
ncbi:DMT family transporter [Celeribacter arenosi]|uniref:DMT family transporter n=1 Tax=Celeribacter arenosi TaxID=792649 RepID=A0ABP7JZM7_9RHOB